MRVLGVHVPIRPATSLGWVVLCLAAGCAEQDNPVLPSSSGHGGVSLGGRPDSGAALDAGTATPDAATDATAGNEVGSDAIISGACNLLEQNCPTSPIRQGCYPAAGRGVCEPAGALAELQTCSLDTDCDRGLVCSIVSTAPLAQGLCQRICALTNGVAAICPSQICAQQRTGFPPGIGACTAF